MFFGDLESLERPQTSLELLDLGFDRRCVFGDAEIVEDQSGAEASDSASDLRRWKLSEIVNNGCLCV